ncbi:MAG TPA: TolC family protein, partial [Burkholderiales bacterium]|nr:TolC family protein [Burkholderiales bacterium]
MAVLLGGCSTVAPYEKPQVDLPEQWQESAPRPAPADAWWKIYGDPALDALVEEAFRGNADLVVAAARVDEARAVLGEANSFFWPSIDAQAGGSRTEVSRRSATAFPGFPREFNDYRATLNVSYDIDLFGRLRAGAEAARAELAASEASRDAVRLALAAQVAKSYYAMQAFDEQVALTRETVRLREEALELQRKRFRGGVISEFELRQLEAETAAVRA